MMQLPRCCLRLHVVRRRQRKVDVPCFLPCYVSNKLMLSLLRSRSAGRERSKRGEHGPIHAENNLAAMKVIKRPELGGVVKVLAELLIWHLRKVDPYQGVHSRLSY